MGARVKNRAIWKQLGTLILFVYLTREQVTPCSQKTSFKYNEKMDTYIILLRGINVGGKNNVSMADLRTCLEELGCSNVSTFIASGNVILQSDKRPDEIQGQIETV